MRTRKAFFNILSGIFLQLITIITSFVITKWFILYYGTEINGLVGAVNQIISALSIIEAGIGTAAIVMLYEPLNDKDIIKVGKILGATRDFYIKSGYIYSIIITIILIFYPILIKNVEYSDAIRQLFLILSIGTLVDYFFFGKYRVLLTASQKLYVINIIQSIFIVISTAVSLYLIVNNYNYLIVKFIGGLIISLKCLGIKIYINYNYSNISIDKNFKDVKLPQRWGAFIHQIATVIVFNTDMVVISIFGGNKAFLLVGIYIVYNYIYISLSNLINIITNSLVPSFGDLFIENNISKIKEIYSKFEFIVYYIVFTAYTCFYILLLPFVLIYTSGVSDADYKDEKLVLLFTIIAILNSIRIPGNVMIAAKGHFNETKNRALLEAVINIVFSIIFVHYFGIYGVLLGTIISYIYRSSDIIYYNNKYIVSGTLKNTLLRLLRNSVLMICICFVGSNIYVNIESYLEWFIYSIFVFLIVFVLFLILNIIFEKDKLREFVILGKQVFNRR